MADISNEELLHAVEKMTGLLQSMKDDIRWLRNREANKDAYMRNAADSLRAAIPTLR